MKSKISKFVNKAAIIILIIITITGCSISYSEGPVESYTSLSYNYAMLPGTPTGITAGEDYVIVGLNTNQIAAVKDGNVSIIANTTSTPAGVKAYGDYVYFCDSGTATINKVNPPSLPLIIAGGGATPGFSGVPATSAMLGNTRGIDVHQGYVYFSDFSNSLIMRFPLNGGSLEVIAGIEFMSGYWGDGVSATQTPLFNPTGLTVGVDGAIYFIDQGNARIRRFTVGGNIETICGNGWAGMPWEGANPLETGITPSDGIAVYKGYVYYVDSSNYIWRFKPGGKMERFAGNGGIGMNPDGTPAKNLLLSASDITIYNGYLYVADNNTNMIIKIKLP